MYKRYLTIIIVLATLVGCFFLFFDKPTNKNLYNEYYNKLNYASDYDFLLENKNLNISVQNGYINNQYHYVFTFTSNKTLNNFKALVIPVDGGEEFYPSFGIIDNVNVNLVDNGAKENETKGVNLVLSNRENIDLVKIYVAYDGYEYYYLMSTTEKTAN
jgi:hypothetical protein